MSPRGKFIDNEIYSVYLELQYYIFLTSLQSNIVDCLASILSCRSVILRYMRYIVDHVKGGTFPIQGHLRKASINNNINNNNNNNNIKY